MVVIPAALSGPEAFLCRVRERIAPQSAASTTCCPGMSIWALLPDRPRPT